MKLPSIDRVSQRFLYVEKLVDGSIAMNNELFMFLLTFRMFRSMDL